MLIIILVIAISFKIAQAMIAYMPFAELKFTLPFLTMFLNMPYRLLEIINM